MSQPDDIPLEKRFAMLDYVTDRISTENRTLEFKSTDRSEIIGLSRTFKEVNDKLKQHAIQLDQSGQDLHRNEEHLLSIDLQMANNFYIWKISNFNMRFKKSVKQAKESTIYSSDFKINGYTIALFLCPNGFQTAKGNTMSIFFSLLRGKLDSLLSWPYRTKLMFTLFDQSESCSHHNVLFNPLTCDDATKDRCLQKPLNVGNPSIGIEHFIEHTKLWTKGYVEDDAIFIKVKEYIED